MTDDALRESYSRIAADYADAVGQRPHLVENAMLGVFAERVRAGAPGPVADVGCGPGRHTAWLRERGLDAFGVDLAPGMVEQARLRHPGLRFEVGSMLALDVPDGHLAGVLAAYSIIHLPWGERPRAFAEFHRVLAPGGQLMLTFQVGDDVVRRDEAYGKPIAVVAYRSQPDDVAALLERAGFVVAVRTVRAPEKEETVPQAYLIAAKEQPKEDRS